MKKVVIVFLVILGLIVALIMLSPRANESFQKGREAGSQSTK